MQAQPRRQRRKEPPPPREEGEGLRAPERRLVPRQRQSLHLERADVDDQRRLKRRPIQRKKKRTTMKTKCVHKLTL